MKIKVEESKWSSWGLALTSGCDEWPGCRLVINWPGKYVNVYLPPILRPARTYRDLLPDAGKPGYNWLTVKADGTCGYWEIHEREFGFHFSDRALHLRYGQQTHEWPGCKSKCVFVPWLEWRHVRTSSYGLKGEHFYTEDKGADFRARHAALDTTPAVKFDFLDFDGERITATTRIEEREWRAGAGWFKWLSWFRAPKVNRTLNLCFSAEVGPKKGSWKGGTTGHSIEMEAGELHESAFNRYCEKYNLTPATPATPEKQA